MFVVSIREMPRPGSIRVETHRTAAEYLVLPTPDSDGVDDARTLNKWQFIRLYIAKKFGGAHLRASMFQEKATEV